MLTDPIADMLTRIRNAQAAGKQEITMPYSHLKHAIATVLMRENYLGRVEKAQVGSVNELKLVLKYRSNGKPYIKHIKRLSVPSRRLYVGRGSLPYVLNNYGIAVISSSKGIMTNRDARREKIGGELLLEVW